MCAAELEPAHDGLVGLSRNMRGVAVVDASQPAERRQMLKFSSSEWETIVDHTRAGRLTPPFKLYYTPHNYTTISVQRNGDVFWRGRSNDGTVLRFSGRNWRIFVRYCNLGRCDMAELPVDGTLFVAKR